MTAHEKLKPGAFFFQAEDGIRDLTVTGVQTCALPISRPEKQLHSQILSFARARGWIALHGDMTRKTGRTLGEPDFVIIADAGRVFFVEAKSMIGVLSPAQAAFRARARDLGHTVHIYRSLA